MKRLGAVLVVLLIAPATAHAAPPTHAARWLDAMKEPRPPTLNIRFESCPAAVTGGLETYGCTWPGGPVFVEPWPDAAENTRFTLYHEIGHQFDWQLGTRRLRQRFRRVAHLHGAWEQPGARRDPHEQFAEAYAICSYPAAYEWDEWEDDGYVESDSYHYRARWKPHRRLCRLLRARQEKPAGSYERLR